MLKKNPNNQKSITSLKGKECYENKLWVFRTFCNFLRFVLELGNSKSSLSSNSWERWTVHERVVSVRLLRRERQTNAVVCFQKLFWKDAAVSEEQCGFEAGIVRQC